MHATNTMFLTFYFNNGVLLIVSISKPYRFQSYTTKTQYVLLSIIVIYIFDIVLISLLKYILIVKKPST